MGDGAWTLGGRSRPAKYPETVNPRCARPSRERELVAAVCYRVRGANVDFLLVKTSGGRWTFPKGGVEPGMTRAQAAAMEALEEAGVHGKIEETCFARYRKHKGKDEQSPHNPIHAHLCEVLRHGPPLEDDRDPTWFSAERAKRRLRSDRKEGQGDELARVVDRAVERVRRLQGESDGTEEPLRKVRFEIDSRTAPAFGDVPRF
jgi:8-oxo-dGTP pyrophosphatase MutT (NUDIX family)